MRRLGTVVLALAVVALLGTMGGSALGEDPKDPGILQAAVENLAGPVEITKTVTRSDGTSERVTTALPWIADATIEAATEGVTKANSRARAAGDDAGGAVSLPDDLGETDATLGCSRRLRNEGNRENRSPVRNARVNQDCTFRRQTEASIAHDPADPRTMLAGMYDSRLGFNQCGIGWSTDRGRHWGDLLPPYRQWTNDPESMLPSARNPNRNTLRGDRGTSDTYDAGGHASVAFDSRGNGYFSCTTFDVGEESYASGVYVTRSPREAQGSFFFNVPETDKRFKVVEDNSVNVFHDKQFIAADYYERSRNRDNVYVTWTVFVSEERCDRDPADGIEPSYCASQIYGSMSTDGAETWSTPELVSTSSPLCFLGDFSDPQATASSCNFNQGSDLAALPSGDLVVVWNNGNTANDNPNAQQLGVTCKPSGESPGGTARLNCGSIVKVGDDVIEDAPQCDFGRGPEECIPGAYIRTNDFPRIAVDDSNGNVYVTWQDYLRRDNEKQEYSIQGTRSTDGSRTWADEVTINPDTELDHYFPAIDISETGEDVPRIAVSYYRTERVPNENASPADGFTPGRDPGVQDRDSDYVLAGGGPARSVPFRFRVLSPVFPPPNGIQSGFNGDYSGITIPRGREAHPIWADTRNVDPFTPANGVRNDEDVFTASVSIPNGSCPRLTGRTGRAGCGDDDD